MMKKSCPALLATVLCCFTGTSLAAQPAATGTLPWETVVNNNDTIPGYDRTFNSYNQPSVNARGKVVFRARSTGRERGPVSGIFTRDITGRNQSILKVADRNTAVPSPNNTCYPAGGGADATTCFPEGSGQYATFNEFPSFPRIAANSGYVATRGNSQPVWTYEPVPGTETRVGSAGVYMQTEAGELLTGASQLGSAPGHCIYQVPDINAGITPGTPFEQFPGSPAVTDNGTIVFKGNFTHNEVPGTGIFYRDVLAGDVPIQLVAHSITKIPGSETPFGSTAPPSAADNAVVFVGVDNEETPSEGGIYLAPLSPMPELQTLVALGSTVPGTDGEQFKRFGEGLSFDGRFLSFWASWGEGSRNVKLYCPQEGNRIRRDYCNHTGDFDDGNGDPLSDCSEGAGQCFQRKQVPVDQGIFLHDTQSGETVMVARTGPEHADFLFWNYSGAPPGGHHGGHNGGEPGGEDGGDSSNHRGGPRWRSSAFAAVTHAGSAHWVAYKARNGSLDTDGVYQDPVDGIYLFKGPGRDSVRTLVDTRTPGPVLDRDAPADSVVTELGLERDGLRGRLLVINASMSGQGGAALRVGIEGDEEEDDMAGIYLARIR